MQDEVREKSVALVIRSGKEAWKLTEQMLKKAMQEYLKHTEEPPHGKQSIKSLLRQDVGAQSIEITDKNIGSFEKVARKYSVDFSVKKIPSERKYIVFFKARDADVLNAAFSEYTAKMLNRQRRKPSLLKQLSQFKQKVQSMGMDKEKVRGKGGMEH